MVIAPPPTPLCPNCDSFVAQDIRGILNAIEKEDKKIEIKKEPYHCSNCGWKGPSEEVNWYNEIIPPWKKY